MDKELEQALGKIMAYCLQPALSLRPIPKKRQIQADYKNLP